MVSMKRGPRRVALICAHNGLFESPPQGCRTPRDALPLRRNSGEKAAPAHHHKCDTAARTRL